MDWFQMNYPFDWFIEIKQTSGNSIPFSAVKPHQLQFLKDLRSSKGAKHKLSDAGRIRQPLDAFGGKNTHSFVVACFLDRNICLAINPHDWIGCKPDSECDFTIPL